MNSKSLLQTIKGFIGILPDKQREIIEKRYGLTNEKPLTLEAIGKEKGLTRERIRQIESVALNKLRQNLNELNDILERIKYQLEIIGGIRREKRLLEEAPVLLIEDPIELWTNDKVKNQWANHINFLLDLSPDFNYFLEKPNIYSNWYLKEEYLNKAINIYKFVEKEVKIHKKPLMLDEYQLLLRKTMKEFRIYNENLVVSYLDVSKKFAFNPFGEFGLIDWEWIKPRNVKTKAYLILKKMNQPMHYEEILQKIKELNFDDKKISINSLHNELIKGDPFVLVGRGIYALKEWGYQEGTVKDILIQILAKKPMYFRDILKEVAKQRLVKDMTVLINLQDKQLFKKLPDGRYSLVSSKR
ncbi:MAG: sigma factor-like helix-turn-helix DNA-binding protein [Minisyncoccia bacterium]